MLVVIAWGAEPASVRTIAAGQSLWLGDRPGDLPLAFDSPAGSRVRLVDFSGAEPRVSIPRGAEPECQIALALGETVSFAVAASTLTVSRVEVDPALSRRLHPNLLPGRYVAGVSVGLFALLALMAISLPLLRLADPNGIERALAIDVLPRLHGTGEPVPPDPPLELAPSRTSYLVAVRGELRCGDVDMGQPDARIEGRYAVKGPADNPDPHLAAHPGRAPVTGPRDETLKRSAGGDRRTPMAVWAHDDALGTDPTSARGAMWGDPIQTAKGGNGLGLRRVEAGWSKRLDWSPLQAGSARLVHAGLRVSGPLRRSLATRAVAARFDRFRACYGAASREISLELGFTVKSSGQLSNPSVVDATGRGRVDPALARCLIESLDGLTFDATGTAPSAVSYPLFFQPASHTSAAPQLARFTRAEPHRKTAESCCGRP